MTFGLESRRGIINDLVVAWAFANKKLWLFADPHASEGQETACPVPPTPSSP